MGDAARQGLLVPGGAVVVWCGEPGSRAAPADATLSPKDGRGRKAVLNRGQSQLGSLKKPCPRVDSGAQASPAGTLKLPPGQA